LIYVRANVIILIIVARTQYNIIIHHRSSHTNRILITDQTNNIHVNAIAMFKRCSFSTVLRCTYGLSYCLRTRTACECRTLLIRRIVILCPWDFMFFSRFVFDSNASCPCANLVRSVSSFNRLKTWYDVCLYDSRGLTDRFPSCAQRLDMVCVPVVMNNSCQCSFLFHPTRCNATTVIVFYRCERRRRENFISHIHFCQHLYFEHNR
jgi:hypothetical protein